jgi:hypothetical protein
MLMPMPMPMPMLMLMLMLMLILQERACPRKISARETTNLTHRIRQQAGSYRSAYAAHFRGCPDRL